MTGYKPISDKLRLGPAAQRIGVHPVTLRRWADAGKIACVRVAGERRFTTDDLDAFAGVVPAELAARPRVEALYVRVSGSPGQESFLAAQEAELRVSATSTRVRVFKDRASGLREHRAGLDAMLAAARAGEITVVRVTHQDRLARFGSAWLVALLARDGVTVEVTRLKDHAGGAQELLEDFTALVTTFAGRMYGIRGRDAKARLLASATKLAGPKSADD